MWTMVTIVTIAMWLGSARFVAAVGPAGFPAIGILDGGLLLATRSPLESAFILQTNQGYLRLWFGCEGPWRSYPAWRVFVPLWLPLGGSIVAAVCSWRRRVLWLRSVAGGCCAGCGYDCRGLAANATCPECGTVQDM
jgi:hypothetical protein